MGLEVSLELSGVGGRREVLLGDLEDEDVETFDAGGGSGGADVEGDGEVAGVRQVEEVGGRVEVGGEAEGGTQGDAEASGGCGPEASEAGAGGGDTVRDGALVEQVQGLLAKGALRAEQDERQRLRFGWRRGELFSSDPDEVEAADGAGGGAVGLAYGQREIELAVLDGFD